MLLNFSLNRTKPRVGLQGWGPWGSRTLSVGEPGWIWPPAAHPGPWLSLQVSSGSVRPYLLPTPRGDVRGLQCHRPHAVETRGPQTPGSRRQPAPSAGQEEGEKGIREGGTSWSHLGPRSLPARGQRGAHNPGHSAFQRTHIGTTDLCRLETMLDRLLRVLKVSP